MPQAERTRNIIRFLRWLRDIAESANLPQCISYIRVEVTEMGGTERTARNYVKDCGHYGLIEESRGRYRITKAGEKWLDRHSA